MAKNRFGHQQNKGFKTPQEGPLSHEASRPAQTTSGRAPETKATGYPGMDKIRGGAAPIVPSITRGSTEARVRSGTDPDVGKNNTQGSLPSGVRSGAAGVGGMSPAGGGKLPSDRDNQRAQIGRNGYAMGGKVNRHGSDRKGEERKESAAERAREAKAGDDDNKYAKGGKVVPPGGGNGGVMGGNAPIPLAQPGGTPSTGIVAGGTLPMTSDTLGTESRVAPPKLRTAQLKRSGTTPSLPRPRR